MKLPLKNFIKHFVFLNLVTRILSQSCNLNLFNENWADEWSLILTQDNQHQYQLLRGQTVPVNSAIYRACEKLSYPTKIKCTAYQSFDKTLPFLRKCTKLQTIKPSRFQYPSTSYCPYELYKIGFVVNSNLRSEFLETYEVCFDQSHLRPIFTINKAYPRGGGRPKSLKFYSDGFFNGAYFSAFSRASVFNRFQQLLGNNQPYMSPSNVDHIIDRGHLTPSADFTLTNLKSSTFNMMNVIPQFKTIDNGNWKVIETWTRHNTRTPTHVCTGVLDCDLNSPNVASMNCVVKLLDPNGLWTPMFLADNRKIPIPLWIYKIVTGFRTSVVFLTLNDIYHVGPVDIPEQICKKIVCPIQLSENVKDGLTYCCNHDEFILNNVPKLWGVC